LIAFVNVASAASGTHAPPGLRIIQWRGYMPQRPFRILACRRADEQPTPNKVDSSGYLCGDPFEERSSSYGPACFCDGGGPANQRADSWCNTHQPLIHQSDGLPVRSAGLRGLGMHGLDRSLKLESANAAGSRSSAQIFFGSFNHRLRPACDILLRKRYVGAPVGLRRASRRASQCSMSASNPCGSGSAGRSRTSNRPKWTASTARPLRRRSTPATS